MPVVGAWLMLPDHLKSKQKGLIPDQQDAQYGPAIED
jgi:hypothetical protein